MDYTRLFPTDPKALLVIGIILLIIVLWKMRYRLIARAKQPEPPKVIQSSAEKTEKQEVDPDFADGKINKSQDISSPSTLNTGDIKCICFRKINGVNVADFTNIPKPVGELYMLDPSCPMTGGAYMVYEDERGDIKDYDPREVVYKVDTSPEMAWFAINWDVVKRVYYVSLQWWKSTAVWFAGLMLGLLAIATLVILD